MARYGANGNVAAIEDANGIVTRASYNAIGQRTSVNDPNQGSWSFVYNALGEVTGQVNARGIATGMSYDVLGRPNARSASVDVTGDGIADTVADSWSYDPVNAKGAPLTSQRTINGQLERSTTSSYDSLARPVQQTVQQALSTGTQTYTTRTKYDSYYGRPIGQEYPNGEAVQQLYSIYGHAIAERDPATGIEYRRTNAVNARGQATSETFGNGMTLASSFQLQTGQLTGLTYATASGPLRQLGYGYDVFGNVKRQSLNGGASREDYSYDQLHRLVSAIRSGAASGTVSYGYSATGNLTKKTDFSADTANAYSYGGGTCGGGPNAVQSVQLANNTTRTYCYDANGNLTGDSAGLAIQYDHQNLPTKATRGSQTDWFRYGPDGMRTRSRGADGARVYLPGYEHRTDTGETKVYVGDYAVISRTGSTRKVEYLLKDRLGSVDAVANSTGSVIETRGYDAFGKPRDGAWNDLNPAKIASTAVTPKGFTQHEHLNQLELIHMNGRAYDYHLGRFTGVDPFIQFPLNSQSLNPYSYILNNPLSGTDPTGYCTESDTGTRVRDCVTVTATMKDGSTVSDTYNTRSSADVARAFATPIPGMGARGGNGGNTTQGTTGTSADGRKDQQAQLSSKGNSSPDLFSTNRQSSLENTCSVAPIEGCSGTNKEDLLRHVQSSEGYDNPDYGPNPHVTASVDKKGRLVLVVPYSMSGQRGVLRQAMRDTTEAWRRVGVIIKFVPSNDRDNSVRISGVRSSEFVTDIRLENGQPRACDCETAGMIGGWVPNFSQAYINVDPLTGRLDRSTGPHELGGHLLGLAHRPTGIMQKEGGDSRRPNDNDATRLRSLYLREEKNENNSFYDAFNSACSAGIFEQN